MLPGLFRLNLGVLVTHRRLFYIISTKPVNSCFPFPDQPENWDEEDDGIWKAPKIPNPAYKGPWKPKVCSCTFIERLKLDTFL